MPTRIPYISNLLTFAFEGLVLGFVAFYQLAGSMLDAETWDRLQGSHGGLFIMAVGMIVLWAHNVATNKTNRADLARMEAGREKRDERTSRELQDLEKNREKRHDENRKTAEAYHDKLIALTVENIRSNLHVAGAVTNLEKSVKHLAGQVTDCPARREDKTKSDT